MKKTRLTILLLVLWAVIPFHTEAVEIVSSYKLSSENGLPDNNIRYLEQDEAGFLRLMSVYEIYQYDGYRFRMLPHEVFLQTKEQQKTNGRNGKGFTHDNQGNKVLTEQGNDIIYLDGKTGEQIRLTVFNDDLRQQSPSLKCNVITDQRGLIWVSVNGNGLFVYDRKTKTTDHITKNDPRHLIDADYIVSMTEDHQGNIWISQEHYGLVCLKVIRQNYEIVNISHGGTSEKENEVRLLQRLQDGTVIVSSNRGLLMRTDGTLQHFTILQDGGDNYNSLALDGQGRLWLGSLKRGVNIEGKWYGKDRIDCILKDNKNRMWTCSLDGDIALAELDGNGQWNERHFITDVEGLRPRSLIQDYKGTIWVAGDKGLFAFEPDELLKDPKRYRKVNDIPSRNFLEDEEHRLWVGTTGMGMGRKNEDDSFSYITREDGLPNNVVQFVVEDSHHRLCIGTEDGMATYDPKTGETHCLYFADNKMRNFYHADCGIMLDDGRMALGSLDGIVVLNKDQEYGGRPIGKTLLTDLCINGVSVYDMGEKSPIEGEVWETRHISLAHDQNALIIAFSNFDLGRSHLSGYSYKLEGYDKEWSRLDKLNYASYKELKPGEYTFMVRYLNKDGWNESEQLLTIDIRSPYWATWWACVLYALALAVIGYAVYRQVRNMERLHQRIAVEKETTEYRLKFFTNISHEFRTPLTLIQAAMEKMGQPDTLPGHIRQPLSNMRKSTDRMLRLINQLLEFRRVQSNKTTLSLTETDIVQFVYNIYIGFHEVAEHRHITYTFRPFSKSYKTFIDREHVDKIVYNLLSNAFKYTPEEEDIHVRIRLNDTTKQLLISVADTGIGISKEKQQDLFSRYATGRISGDSIGIGLNLAQELARIHHGQITFEENKPKGSLFTLVLPTDKGVYEETDFLHVNNGIKTEEGSQRRSFADDYQELKTKPLNDRRVLVAEDNHELCILIQNELSPYFEVDRASNGVEALELLKAAAGSDHPYDLLVSDVMMPQMNGFELTRQIRADKEIEGLPVILLTALTDEEQMQKGITVGADAYIEKPFSPKRLTIQAVKLIEQRDRLKAAYAQQPQRQKVKELVKNDADRKFIQQLDAYIDRHLSDTTLSVDVMAEHFEYGRTRFYNKVRAITGCTPNDYLKEKRLKKAAELLSESETVTVAEVAYKVGISNAQYFSVNFKKMFGVTPSNYQKGEENVEH